MASNICKILVAARDFEKSNETQNTGMINLNSVPIGDLFKTTAFSPEEYELFGKVYFIIVIGSKNIFYSSEYMKLAGESLKNLKDTPKL